MVLIWHHRSNEVQGSVSLVNDSETTANENRERRSHPCCMRVLLFSPPLLSLSLSLCFRGCLLEEYNPAGKLMAENLRVMVASWSNLTWTPKS